MKKTIWKSIGAILAGFITGTILAATADFAMQAAGLMDMERFKDSPAWVILIVTAYRFVFSIVACYITARFAPTNPMKHALILGSIGLVLSILGSVVMWEHAVVWYNLAIILMALPCAYIGGRLYKPKS